MNKQFKIPKVYVGTLITASALLSFPNLVSAADITFDFASPKGSLGKSSYSYTESGETITAYGFDKPSTPRNLFGKQDGLNEAGLGLDGTPDNEINSSNFIQLDVSSLNPGTKPVSITLGSLQAPEQALVYGSNDKEKLDVLLATLTGTPLSQTYFFTPDDIRQYKYFGVTGGGPNNSPTSPVSGDTVIGSFVVRPEPRVVPEPSALLGLGAVTILGIGAAFKRQSFKKSQDKSQD